MAADPLPAFAVRVAQPTLPLKPNVPWSCRAIDGSGVCSAALYGVRPQLNFRR